MKKLILLAMLFTSTAFAQNVPSQKAYQPPVSLLENGGFEIGKATWTNSGGTFAIVTSGSNLLYDKASATFDASAVSQYIQSKLYTVPAGLYGGNCAASVDYIGGDTNLKLVALDGSSNVLATRTFESAALTKRPFGISFPCPSSGTFRVRLESLADAAIVAVDRFKLGEFDSYQVATPSYFGSLTSTSTANCIWTTTSGTLANFAADTDCPTPTVTGKVTAPGTKIPGLVIEGPGDFLITMQGAQLQNLVLSDGAYSIRLSNGSQNSNVVTGQLVQSAGFSAITTGHSFSFSINLPAGSHTVQVQAATPNPTLQLLNQGNTDTAGLNFQVYKFPSATETAFQAHTIGWLVDANISGANASLGTAAQTAYVEIFDGGLAMVQNLGSIGAQIPCDTTNPSTGLTCAAGNESVGVVFNVPASGTVEACVEFGYYTNSGNASPQATFQIVETPNNAQTILQEGKSRLVAGVANQEAFIPYNLCSTLYFGSAGQKTLRLMYEQNIKTNAPQIIADAGINEGQRDIHWRVRPLTQHVPAPVLISQTLSEVRMDTGNGYGSTNTKIRRYTNTVQNVGSDITCTDSATLGASCTVLTNGKYCIAIGDSPTGASMQMGISVNSSSVSSSMSDLTYAQGMRSYSNPTSQSHHSICLPLVANDVIRMQGDGAAGVALDNAYIHVMKMGF